MGAEQSRKRQRDKTPPPKREAPAPMTRFKQHRRRRTGVEPAFKLPTVTPRSGCYLRVLKLNRTLDWLMMEEEFLQRRQALSPLITTAQKEHEAVVAFRGSPLGVGKIVELVDDNHAIITIEGSRREFYVPILTVVDADRLHLSSAVLTKQAMVSARFPAAVAGVLPDELDAATSFLKIDKAPPETYEDIGGLDSQIQELREAVELPLTNPALYEEMGIKPPKGVILYGPPGTGKTLLAKAVANSTSATFMRAVGSELVQKFSGEGPKLIRDLFRLAEEHAPTIIFLDEIDAVGSKRYDTQCRGEREVQRTMLELLTQLDGFDGRGDVRVIMATNRVESLDPALIRPGRIDRKIEMPLPDDEAKRRIFAIHSSRMTLAQSLTYEAIFGRDDTLTGAEIKAVCSEAGLLALRERAKMASKQNFLDALERVKSRKTGGTHEAMFV